MERTSNELPLLIGQSGPLNGQKWIINDALTIGRDPECDIVIPDRQVSRFHARLTPTLKGIVIEDLGSKNGTYCNRLSVNGRETLQDGYIVQIALIQEFVYLSSDATMPIDRLELIVQDVVGDLKLDKKSRRVWIKGVELNPSLSAPQYKLLEVLFDAKERVVARQEIITSVWGEKEALGVSDQALDALVRRLRDRLGEVDIDHEYVITVRGHGLRLDNPISNNGSQ